MFLGILDRKYIFLIRFFVRSKKYKFFVKWEPKKYLSQKKLSGLFEKSVKCCTHSLRIICLWCRDLSCINQSIQSLSLVSIQSCAEKKLWTRRQSWKLILWRCLSTKPFCKATCSLLVSRVTDLSPINGGGVASQSFAGTPIYWYWSVIHFTVKRNCWTTVN